MVSNIKKILFVNSSLTSGGSERVMSIIANSFAEKGYDTAMILLREKPKSYTLHVDVKVTELKYNTKNKLLIAIKRMMSLRAFLKKFKPDYVISFMWDINIFTLLASWGLQLKVIVSERNNPLADRTKLIHKIEKEIFVFAHKIVFQTNYVMDIYPDNLRRKSVIIPNPANRIKVERIEDNIEKKFVAIGRLHKQKNFHLLLDSFSDFHEQYPDYRLAIFGEGPLKAELVEYAKVKNVEDSVHFGGFIEKVEDQIVNATAYISTSDYEGISNSMIEALAMGLPVICTDCPVGGAKTMIQHNTNGVLVNVGDRTDVVNAMIKIVEDKSFTTLISKNAKKSIEKYSIENISKLWFELVDDK